VAVVRDERLAHSYDPVDAAVHDNLVTRGLLPERLERGLIDAQARAGGIRGTPRPSALAVIRSRTISSPVGSSTGKPAGLTAILLDVSTEMGIAQNSAAAVQVIAILAFFVATIRSPWLT
jgi:hypothetical protein